MKLRTFFFWPHLIAGLVAGLVILMMSVTGVLLTYERQMVAWSDSHFRSSPARAGTERLPVESLLAAASRAEPDSTFATITIGSDADAPAAVSAGQRTLYLDAYSGRVLGEGSQGVRRFMSGVRAWHRWFAFEGEGRDVARSITGWSNFIFLFIVMSGFYLWLPRRWSWQHLRPVVWFVGTARGKARDFNWHNAIGIWSAIPLFIVVLAALPISFPWANAAVYRVVGEDPPPNGRGREGGAGPQRREGGRERGKEQASFDGLNALVARAEQQVEGWRTITLRMPSSAAAPVVFAIDAGDGGQPQLRSTLTLARATGAVVSYEAFSDQSLGRRLRSIARFAHTGEVLGLPGQTIAGAATLGAVFLGWTGIALALRRFRSWLARRSTRTAIPAESQQSAA